LTRAPVNRQRRPAVALYIADNDFCRINQTIRRSLAIKAGIAGHPWTRAEQIDQAGV
jgi:hypothetical protein